MTYEETMIWGAKQYADAIAALQAADLPACFTQTGGMNAAIAVPLLPSRSLLITDAEDALSWARADQEGWAVGLYSELDDHDGPIAFGQIESNETADLLALIADVRSRDELPPQV